MLKLLNMGAMHIAFIWFQKFGIFWTEVAVKYAALQSTGKQLATLAQKLVGPD